MSQQQLQVIAPNPKLHKEALYDLVCKTFGNYTDFMQRVRANYIEHSHYDWQATRIGLINGQIVTHFGPWDYQMRIGSALLRTGGIGTVATHYDFRKRGLMELTAPACIQAMRDLGYDFSVLFGINNFYHRFGYTRAWSEVTYFLNLTDLPKDPPSQPLRKFTYAPRADLHALYNRHYATTTGTAHRPTYSRANPSKNQHSYLWNNPQGKPAGYFILDDQGNQLVIKETVGDTAQILAGIAQIARKLGADQVRFPSLPYNTHLAQTLRRGTCRMEINHRQCGGAMIRTINLPQVLRKLAPELARRLAASPYASFRGQLTIADKNESATLNLRPGSITLATPPASKQHAIRGGDEIAQLLLGTDDPLLIADQFRIRLTGDATRLLPFLFPNQHPMLHAADHF